jgi:hypothetical protein
MRKLPKDFFVRPVRGLCLGLSVVLPFIVGSFRLQAQVSSTSRTVSVRGKIAAVKGQELILSASSGVISVKVPDTANVRGEVRIKFSDIASGMYLGTTAEKQADGTFRASEVHVFSEDQRGVGEGHRPSSSVPNSTMTNANVDRVDDVAVQDIKGRLMTLKYKDGEVKVFVPPDIPIVKRVLGDRAMLKPGVEVSIQAIRAPEGSLTASQITVRAGKDKS